MTTKYYILSCLITLLSSYCLQSQTIEVKGWVVEVTDGGFKGVAGVKVSVTGESYDITRADGSFSLFLPQGREYVKIEVENCPHPVISPVGNKIYLPPFDPLKIQICAAANSKLQAKVEALNGQLTALERKRQHTGRQLEKMRQLMLDTILHYEAQVQALQGELAGRDATVAQQQTEISALEKRVASLEQQLFKALEEKYLRQKKQFDAVSAGLEEYLDQMKNLRDMLLPNRVGQYFSENAGARPELYKVIENYNMARNDIVRKHEQNVVAVANDWEDPDLADELEATYEYLLEDVHEKGIYPLEFSVNENLKQYLTGGNKGSTKRAATDGAELAVPKLAVYIQQLEKQVADILLRLKTEM